MLKLIDICDEIVKLKKERDLLNKKIKALHGIALCYEKEGKKTDDDNSHSSRNKK